MDEFLSEKEQAEVLRQWWRENGLWIVGGLVVGALALFGWRAWNDHLREQAEAASAIYGELLAAVDAGDREKAVALEDRLSTDFARTAYAAQAGLALARLYVHAGDAEGAAGALSGVLTDAEDTALAHIARLRLARVRLEQDRPDDAEQALAGVEEGRFAPLYAHVRGDILAARGDTAAARDAYRRALAASEPGVVDRNLVQMKLDALGQADAEQPAGEPEPEPEEATS